jgi:hypothetical protein
MAEEEFHEKIMFPSPNNVIFLCVPEEETREVEEVDEEEEF